MVVDSKQLISDIVLDTDNKMHKQCKFCGKLLHINDYTALYVNIVYKDIATAYERCTCNEASKIWQQYDEYIEKDKIRKINLSKINKLFKNNNLGKRQLNSIFENYKITNKNKNAYENVKKYVDKLIKGTTNKGLFITGAYGVGKTYLASCIANEIIKNEKSEDIITEFLGKADFSEVQLNQELSQRIILVAREFRKEVTNTVIWARKFGMKIQCIKVIPFNVGNNLVVDTDQIIPVKDIADNKWRRTKRK